MAKKNTLEAAFELFQEKKFDKASKAMEKLLEGDGVDVYTASRLRQFKCISDRQNSNGKPAKDDLTLNDVVFHMNRCDYSQAETILGNLDVDDEVAYFLRSEMAVEQGKVEAARDFLAKAVDINRDNLGYAKNSRSFRNHLNDKKLAPLFQS